jgi:hypothetical protein
MTIDQDWTAITQHLNAGVIDLARPLVQKLIKDYPSHDLSRCADGLLGMAIGDLERARAGFERAIALNPQNLDARIYLALTLRKPGTLEAYAACRDVLLNILSTFPDTASNHKRTNFILQTAAECCDKAGPVEDSARLWKMLAERALETNHDTTTNRNAQITQSDGTARGTGTLTQHGVSDTKPRHVVCFVPYVNWTLHGAREITLLHALHLRGCSVSTVLCDGVFDDCEVYREATPTSLHRPAACLVCQSHAARHLAMWGMPYRWLGRWLNDNDFEMAFTWVAGLSPQDYPGATWNGWTLGEWVKSSLHSYFRQNTLDLSEERIAGAYARYLTSAMLAGLALSRLFDTEKPDVQILMNGRMGILRVALELAKARGIRTICEERAYVLERVSLFDNVSCMDNGPLGELWRTWRDIPMTRAEVGELSAILRKRWAGKSGELIVSPPAGNSVHVTTELGLDPRRPIWVLFTSCMDECVSNAGYEGAFPSQEAWIDATVAYAAHHPDIQLVIRVHPNTGSSARFGANSQELRYFAALSTRLPANVRLVNSASKISSYDLASCAQVGLVWHSTIGLEVGVMGRTIVRAGTGWLSGASFCRHPDRAEAYELFLDDVVARPQPAPADIIAAWRYAYLFFVRQTHDFPFVEIYDWSGGRITYDKPEALAPGQNASLDHICEAIINGTSLDVLPEPRGNEISLQEREAIINELRHMTAKAVSVS